MAFLKTSVKLIIRESKTLTLSDPALTLGVPEVYASFDELSRWVPEFLERPCSVTPAEAKLTSNVIGERFGWVQAATFFGALGLHDVTSIDIPGCEHPPDLTHDMNQPLPSSFVDKFGCVFDPGTTEHVFDLKTALTSIVRALKLGGTVIHQVPVYSYNGGYVSVNPNLLNDFYSRNGFDQLRTFIIMWDRYHAYSGKHRVYEYTEGKLGQRHSLSDKDQCRFSPHMLFMARKSKNLADIVTPLQYEGQYVSGIVGTSSSPVRDSATRALYRTIRGVAYRVFPFSTVFSAEARLNRWRYLLRTRKGSYFL